MSYNTLGPEDLPLAVLGGAKVCARMSQEDSKWLVNGL